MLFDWVLATDHTDQNHNDCNNKKDMDKITKRKRSNYSKKPKNKKDNCDCH